MKNKKLLIAILCIFVFDLPGAANRIRQNFDFDWQFRLGENGDFREVHYRMTGVWSWILMKKQEERVVICRVA